MWTEECGFESICVVSMQCQRYTCHVHDALGLDESTRMSEASIGGTGAWYERLRQEGEGEEGRVGFAVASMINR